MHLWHTVTGICQQKASHKLRSYFLTDGSYVCKIGWCVSFADIVFGGGGGGGDLDKAWIIYQTHCIIFSREFYPTMS